MMDKMRGIITFLTFCIFIWKTVDSSAATYDCRQDPLDYNTIDISETDPVDTVLVTFNNSLRGLRWTASVNGSSKSYLSLFFKSSMVEDAEDLHSLTLAKILDLELLQLELTSSSQLFVETTYDVVTLDLSVFCVEEPGITNEWHFKIHIQSVNEFYPQFMGSPFKATVKESAAVGTEIFNIGARATDIDAGQNNLTFNIAPYMITQFDGSRYVKLDDQNRGSIVVAQPLDFEAFYTSGRTYIFVNVTATDEGGYTSATSINVTVTDSNDQGVQLVYPGCARPCLTANYSVLTNESFVGRLEVGPVSIHAEDLDTLNDSVIYTLESDIDREFFDIDSTTAKLFKTSPLVNDSYGFAFTIEVRAQETTNEDHFLTFNISVLISERLPKLGNCFYSSHI
ncbi:cadherin-99C-like [Ruditapes philippinarum]|uniref:cadherin-99C-like n=1 Tax=Ruditapes philippinarum TaxID=129788 RepID=UPI00295A76EC|nr:cadherin-99C-like [Ruditapes philippinarum]